MFIDPTDSLDVMRLKIELWNIRTYLDMSEDHRAEIDRAVANAFRRWDELNNKEVA